MTNVAMRSDEEAWELAAENLRLVWWTISKKFHRIDEHRKDDLYSEGCIGLFSACRDWNPELGKLSTLAVPRIWSRCQNYLVKALCPVNVSRADLLATKPGDHITTTPIELEEDWMHPASEEESYASVETVEQIARFREAVAATKIKPHHLGTFDLLAQGLSDAQIAEALGVSLSAANRHRRIFALAWEHYTTGVCPVDAIYRQPRWISELRPQALA